VTIATFPASFCIDAASNDLSLYSTGSGLDKRGYWRVSSGLRKNRGGLNADQRDLERD
jgi:hypothetical protein